MASYLITCMSQNMKFMIGVDSVSHNSVHVYIQCVFLHFHLQYSHVLYIGDIYMVFFYVYNLNNYYYSKQQGEKKFKQTFWEKCVLIGLAALVGPRTSACETMYIIILIITIVGVGYILHNNYT